MLRSRLRAGNVKVFDSLRPHGLACQSPLCTGFSRQEYQSWQSFSSPGESSQPRDRTRVSHIAGRLFNHLNHQGSPQHFSDTLQTVNAQLEVIHSLNRRSCCVSFNDILSLGSWIFHSCCDKKQDLKKPQCGTGNDSGRGQSDSKTLEVVQSLMAQTSHQK